MIPAIIAIVVVAVAGGLAFTRRRPRPAMIDPFTIGEPWRRHVSQALSLQRGYGELVDDTTAGPLRDRMRTIGQQIDKAVQECYQIAQRGDQLDGTLRQLNAPGLRIRLERAGDDASRASLQSQIDSAERIRATRDDTDRTLRLLTTRMGELLSQGAEVRVGADASDELRTGVDDVVRQLEALHQAVDDVNQASTPRQMPSP